MDTVTLLMTALVFGGMTLFSFGFAAVLFAVFDGDTARRGIRGAFPFYYLFVIGAAGLAAVLAVWQSVLAAVALALVALTTIYARQVLMHQINAATDRGDKGVFSRLHGLSVGLQLAQIGAVGWVLTLI